MTPYSLPNNEAYERATVASFSVDPGLLGEHNGRLQPDLFYIERWRFIYEAQRAIFDRGELVTVHSLTAELKKRKRYEAVGGAAGIGELDVEPDLIHADFYIDELIKLAKERADKKASIELDLQINRLLAKKLLTPLTPEEATELAYLLRSKADEVDGGSAKLETPRPFADVPELPAEVGFDPVLAAGAGLWVDQYADYAAAVSPMTPRPFHVSAALFMGAVAIARRLRMRLAFGDIFTNLFIIWIAASTLWAKTTALEIARSVTRRAIGHLLAPQEATQEALLSDMAGNEPANYSSMTTEQSTRWKAERNYAAQRGQIIDEASSLLEGAKKDYMAGVLETYLRLFNCDPHFEKSSQGRGRTTVTNAYLSMLTASTPGAMSPHIRNDRLWANGWWARFALLSPEELQPAWAVSKAVYEPPELVNDLKRLFSRLPPVEWPAAPKAIDVTLDAGVFDLWGRYDKALRHDLLKDSAVDQQLWPLYGRLPTQALKVAMILAAFDWGDAPSPMIELCHMMRAIGIAETWRASAHRVVSLAATNESGALAARILRIISLGGERGASLRDLALALRDKARAEIQTELDQLVTFGEVVIIRVEPGKKGGRPSDRYLISRA